MADNILYTQGAGTTLATDDIAGVHYQRVKLSIGADGAATDIAGDTANGIDVDVTRVSGNVTVVQATATNLKVDASGVAVPVTDNSGSLTVDAPVGTPVFVRLSDGSAAITALPVTDNSGSLTVDAPVATPVFVRLSDGSAAITALPVTDNSGSLTVDAPVGTPVFVRLSDGSAAITALPVTDNAGSLTVDGTVTANQGTAAAAANAWPVKVSDGTDTVGISTVGGNKALKVDVIQAVSAASQVDKTAFTEGTTSLQVVGAVFNDTIVGDPAEDQATALRITQKKGLHVNLRNASGTEVGTGTNPLGADLRQVLGTAHSDTNPVKVSVVGQDRTRVTKQNTWAATETGITIWTPGAGKKFVILGLILSAGATGAGQIKVFDNTDAAGNRVVVANLANNGQLELLFPHPWVSSTADNVLKYTTGAGAVGDLTVYGYEI